MESLSGNIISWQYKKEPRLNTGRIIFIIFTVIGLAARIYSFGSIPPGLNADEASIGYDAYSLLHYGMDRNGIHNPVHLIGWGSGQNALYAYLLMPFIYFFGLTSVTVRLVNLLAGIASMFIFYLLIKKISNKTIALISFCILAINPWHIMMSRWALESNLFPAVLLAAVYLLTASFEKKALLPAAMFVMALCLYSYGTSYLFLPLFLLMAAPYIIYHKKTGLLSASAGTAVFAATAAPIILFVIINYFKLQTISLPFLTIPRLTSDNVQFITQSSLSSGAGFFKGLLENMETFITYIITQKDVLWNVIPQYGYMYIFSLPLLILGLVKTAYLFFVKKGFRKSFVILAWFISAVLMAFFMKICTNRINIIFFPMIFFAAVGIYSLKNSIFKRIQAVFIILIALLHITYFSFFMQYYLTTYPGNTAQLFHKSFGEAITYASQQYNGKIYVTDKANMPYIFVLFYTKADTGEFVRTVQYADPASAFRNASSFGRYVFRPGGPFEEGKAYIVHNSDIANFDEKDYVIKRFELYSSVIKR